MWIHQSSWSVLHWEWLIRERINYISMSLSTNWRWPDKPIIVRAWSGRVIDQQHLAEQEQHLVFSLVVVQHCWRILNLGLVCWSDLYSANGVTQLMGFLLITVVIHFVLTHLQLPWRPAFHRSENKMNIMRIYFTILLVLIITASKIIGIIASCCYLGPICFQLLECKALLLLLYHRISFYFAHLQKHENGNEGNSDQHLTATSIDNENNHQLQPELWLYVPSL